MNLDMDTSKCQLELTFGPRWTYIATVRVFLQNFLAVGLSDQPTADKIAMSASELLENAVKYATREGTLIQVRIDDAYEYVWVATENYANPEGIEVLKKDVEFLNQHDPLQAYLLKMQEAVTRTDGKSQLGLARIQHEANGRISLSVLDDNRVRVVCTFQLSGDTGRKAREKAASE